jgi:tetratricopeptide (TPR) repeat protein
MNADLSVDRPAPATSLFAPLDRVVAKYKRDVHSLASGASSEAVTALEAHLQSALPPTLRQFLMRHNGGSLFRGLLRLRSTSEIAVADAKLPGVILFADGQGDVRWAYASDGRGGHVFGQWDGFDLRALHGTFAGWLSGTLAVLDSRVLRPEDQEALRFDADPEDVHQLVLAGERALRAGRPEEAEGLLRRATSMDPEQVAGWQRLGDALTISDRQAARMAWLQAFRNERMPLPWPGAPVLDPEILRPLAAAFPDVEDYERELEHFLADQVKDVASERESRVVVGTALELARSLVRRGRRSQARDVLADLLARSRVFTWNGTPWDALLELARLEIDLGHHDEAEALVRRVRKDGPPSHLGAAWLALGRVAVTRQEPWAEEILDDALAAGLADDDKVEALTLRVERAVRHERADEARKWLNAAAEAVRGMAVRPLQAAVALAEGDVLRLEGHLPHAKEALKRGLSLLAEKDDAELRYRILLRLGDVALAEQKGEEALRSYQAAAEGFASHELPVREGWALLRLARVARNPEPLLSAARDRFALADLAAGISAVDAMRGDPGASLPWHLDRATAQARARYDAQRARPPFDRSDADRPERRLGAHRFAIAACTDGVVDAIAKKMADCARAIATGRGRVLDPPVMEYIAAVDLISAHRSYAAAQVLLLHLLRGAVEGGAWRALQGAIARSPNTALVDGLLSAVELPDKHPADAVAAAAEVLGLRREREAVRPLTALAGAGANPIARKAAVAALGRIGDRTVVDAIEPALEDGNIAETAALALLMLGDRRGVDFHGRALAEGKRDLSGSPGEIVGRYGGPSHLLLLVRTAQSGADDRALGALQGLGLMGDPRGVPTLLDALANRDRKVVEVAAGALTILTGHAEEMEEIGGRHRWAAWWETNGPRMKEGVRHRDGKVFDSGLLLAKMDHDDPWVRRTAYDELVITTGASLPFDADGPWRVQRAHLAAWNDWWTRSRARQPGGHWYLDGKRIS